MRASMRVASRNRARRVLSTACKLPRMTPFVASTFKNEFGIRASASIPEKRPDACHLRCQVGRRVTPLVVAVVIGLIAERRECGYCEQPRLFSGWRPIGGEYVPERRSKRLERLP